MNGLGCSIPRVTFRANSWFIRLPCDPRNAPSLADCSLTSRNTLGSINCRTDCDPAVVGPYDSAIPIHVSATTKIGSAVSRNGPQNIPVADFRGNSSVAPITATATTKWQSPTQATFAMASAPPWALRPSLARASQALALTAQAPPRAAQPWRPEPELGYICTGRQRNNCSLPCAASE